MEYKQSAFEIKDMDEKQGVVVAYANAYDNQDSDGDTSQYGSFVKTVKENRKRIRVLKDHDRRVSLGVPLEIDPYNRFGLLTTTQFNMKKEVSRDMFTDIQLMKENDLNAELSIGVDIVERDNRTKSLVKEYKLWEYSFLTSWAANELATVGSIKNLKSVSGILELIEKSYDLSYSDPRLRKIERLLKSLTGPSQRDTRDKPIQTKEFANKILLTYQKSFL